MKRCLVLLAFAWSLSAWAYDINVTVSTPINGATVTSPVPVKASATSTHRITGWRIYVDGVSVYQAGAVNSISTSLTMASGTHKMIVRAWNSVGHYASASLTITVSATTTSGVTVGISPTSATLQAGSGTTQTFTASVSGSTNTGVTWSMSGIGGITSSGNTAVYTPPTSGSGSATVTATSVADPTKSAAAQITVTAPSSTVSVSISPTNPTVQASASQQFTATVSGTTNTAVNWLVNGVTGGSSSTGTISSAGLYTAPVCPSVSGVKITAQSVYDTTVTSSTTATLTSTTPSGYYFVATNGSDSNSGDACHPWATLQHAANTVSAGNTVIVEDGTYNQTVKVTRSGSSGYPITFKAQHTWGAKLAPSSPNSNGNVFEIAASYINVQGLEISGTANSAGNIANGIRSYNGYSHVNVTGNKIHNLGNGACESGAAIESGANNSLITGNFIYLIGLPWSSTPTCGHHHGIYGVGTETGAYYANNILFQIYQGFAFHFNDAAINNITVTNNTIFNVGDQGYGGAIVFSCQSGTCDYLTFSNNIIANTNLNNNLAYGCFNETQAGGTGTFGSHNVFTNNVVDTTCRLSQDVWMNGNHDTNTKQVSNVGFVNYTGDSTGDYHLLSSSPAITEGAQDVGLTNISSGSWPTNTSSGGWVLSPLYDYSGATRPQSGDSAGAYQYK